jgi:paraquat-inducible protein B
VGLTKDMQHVEARVRLQRSAAGLANEGSQFWIVRPEVSSGGLHGLETIVSGPYIQARPGGGKPQARFLGVEEAPVDEDKNGKFEVVLTTPQINTLSVGSSVYYRGVEVGNVSYFALNGDAQNISIHVLIETNFAPLIRSGTKFWNAGGISVRLKLLGINVSAENFKSLIIGGIAFATPNDPGPPVSPGATFPLYTKPENSWLDWSPSISITNAKAKGSGDASPSMLLNDVSPPSK